MLARSILCFVLVAAVGATVAQESPLPRLPTVSLKVGTRVISAEVAATTGDRMRGLMYRRELAPDAGMLFVFGRERGGEVCMWMKNTGVPLSAAFIDGDGRVINIADMKPHTETMHCAAGRADYVLEVNQGTFSAAGVKPGTRIDGLPRAMDSRAIRQSGD